MWQEVQWKRNKSLFCLALFHSFSVTGPLCIPDVSVLDCFSVISTNLHLSEANNSEIILLQVGNIKQIIHMFKEVVICEITFV